MTHRVMTEWRSHPAVELQQLPCWIVNARYPFVSPQSEAYLRAFETRSLAAELILSS